MTPNELAWLTLESWPFVALAVFAARRSTARLARTTAWMLFLPVMFLPPNLDLPFAGLNKHRVAMLSIALALALFHPRDLVSRDRWRSFPFWTLLVFAAGASQTIRTNADPISFGVLTLPGLGPRDLAWTVYGYVVDMYLPFVIGQRVFRSDRDLRDLFAVLSTCVLIYAPLCLFEMRFSPQLSRWVYGYHPHQFIQSVRGTGYRPVVFMSHGIPLSMFLLSGLCASIGLHQARVAQRPSAKARAIIAQLLLLASKSLASILYSGMALVLTLWCSAKLRARLAAALGVLVFAYPAMRMADLVPTEDVVDTFARYSTERSASLMTRFNQEGQLLDHAIKRPLFGWGGWGRSRIYTWWGERGDSWAGYKDTSVTDGTWIIWLGGAGLVGFAASFALLVVPLLRYARLRSGFQPASQALVGALAVMVAVFTLDLLPNAQFDLLPIVYAGSLFALSRPRAHEHLTRQPARPGAANDVDHEHEQRVGR